MARSDSAGPVWLERWRRREAAPAEPTGRGRRETERLMAYWEQKLKELGGEVTIAGLDLSRTDGREWSNRFLISVDPIVERSALVLYGPQFARLLGLPERPPTDRPLLRQVPRRYGEVFLRGCTEVQRQSGPVRLDGEVERADDRVEQYRAIFIPVRVRPNSLTCFAFGAFNSRVVARG
jgi:hypothetical protein